MSAQLADERASVAPMPGQVGGQAVMLIPHRAPGVGEATLPPDHQRILAAARQSARPVMAQQVGEMLGVDVSVRRAEGERHETHLAELPPATDTITATAHGLPVGNKIVFTTTGAMSGVVAGRVYYVVTVTDANNFKISTTFGGAAITVGTATPSPSPSLDRRP